MLRFVCIEVRKNLHCANVFLQFDRNLTQTACLKINVEKGALRLRTEDAQPINILLAPYLTVEAYTMSNLTVEECNASFRLTVASLNEIEFNVAQEAVQQLKLNLDVKNSDATSIHCANCECALITEGAIEFQRIREFPSGSVDTSEFFCHNAPDFGAVLVPQMTDFFYGYKFVVLNVELLRTTTKEKDTHLYCRRCLQYLGETLFEGRAIKLWTDTLRLKNKTTANKIDDIFISSDDAFSPAYGLLNQVISDSDIAKPYTSFLQFTKVLLQASFPNRQKRYLLLHILEKQLSVLRNMQPFVQTQQVADQKDVLQLELTASTCIKLLFRHIQPMPDGNGDNSKKVLTTWQRDWSIQTIKISPTLFSALLAELDSNTKLLPELYRNSRDEFQLSYVF